MESKLGAPSKLNQDYINAFSRVVNNKLNAVYLNLEEIHLLTNFEMGDHNYICFNTFDNWRKAKLTNPFVADFLGVYKKALINQKLMLFEKFENDKGAWQKWAWVIERKFEDWNLKRISETKADINVREFPNTGFDNVIE